MASLIITSLAAAGLLLGPVDEPDYAEFPAEQLEVAPEPDVQAVRGACDTAVAQAMAMTGGELLSVEPARNGKPICKVTILVINKNGRPRKVKLRIPMDF